MIITGDILNFIEKIFAGTKNFTERLNSKYIAFKNIRLSLNRNLDELFVCTSSSFGDAIFQNQTSSANVGVYADFLANQNLVYHKLSAVEKDVDALEDILLGQKSGNSKSSNRKPSRFKSAYISILAGMGTTTKLYEMLRSRTSLNVDDGKEFIKASADSVEESVRESTEEFVKEHKYSVNNINDVLSIKHKYFWKDEKQLSDLIEKDVGLKILSIDDFVRDAMMLKVNNTEYVNNAEYKDITRINYDSRIASQEMQKELTEAYMKSDKTLKVISYEFEKKYGMHVSVSTISVNARKQLFSKGLDFNSRREAKKYYSEHNIQYPIR